MKHILILGGTGEARRLADRLAGTARVTLSLAGRTERPLAALAEMRSGGFGGAAGLARFMVEAKVDVLVDATHPFAARISHNAELVARQAGLPLLVVERPAWEKADGDRWIEAADMAHAAASIGPAPRRVLLAVGRQELAPFAAHPQHAYLIRSVDPAELPPGLAHARAILARGPFDEAQERALLLREGIEMVVAKNSGGDATYGKIAAARALALPVVMVRRPRPRPPGAVAGVEEALAHLAALPAERGE
ncbi:cobalt-precorrin-6A reductase [Aureimonas populi]|uniref:Cobalt-precorrin-6A reductase n=2 Tax=Aureimonas populi TaxID=1701758 RepID=A0ABW5CL79_9HYPH